jgi:hypothetical protein
MFSEPYVSTGGAAAEDVAAEDVAAEDVAVEAISVVVKGIPGVGSSP